MKDNKEYSWYKLINTPGFGQKSIHYIYSCMQANGLTIDNLYKSDEKKLQELFPEIGKGKFSKALFLNLVNIDDTKTYSQYEKLKTEKIYIIGLDDERYPKSVLNTLKEDAPVVLFCKGFLPLLKNPGISIVGARDVSDFAVLLTKKIAGRLAGSGFNVTSGYAKGVDTSAHFGALEAGGTTTMILSYGMNYLSIKKDLKELDWEKNTLFVTQFLPYEKFSGQNAMARNKLVCAMSQAVIVISSGPEKDENGKSSGTFDAGKSALNMNIPLFVLSPEILKPTPKGNIDLIKMGGISLANGTELLDYINTLNTPIPKIIQTPQVVEAVHTKSIRKLPTPVQLNLNL